MNKETEWEVREAEDNCKVTWVWDYCTLTATANASDESAAVDLATDWVRESGIDTTLLATASYIDIEYFGDEEW